MSHSHPQPLHHTRISGRRRRRRRREEEEVLLTAYNK
jgi:hypothetical protein